MANEVAKRQPAAKNDVKAWLNSPTFQSEIAKVLPAHLTPERMVRIACTALMRVPKLADCTQASIFQSLLDLSQWGLEPDGRHAHLIPYGNECKVVIDFKGYVQLVMRTGQYASIAADVVRRGDLFRYRNHMVEEHIPWFARQDVDERPNAEGDIYAAYCVIVRKDGANHHEVMSRSEIDGVRKSSRAGNSGPWKDYFPEMAKKTVFRRATKWLELSSDVRAVIDADFDTPGFDQQRPRRARLTTLPIKSMALEHRTESAEPEAAEPADPQAAFRAEQEAWFAAASAGDRLKRYDEYCGPDSQREGWQIEIVSAIYERLQ